MTVALTERRKRMIVNNRLFISFYDVDVFFGNNFEFEINIATIVFINKMQLQKCVKFQHLKTISF